MGLGMLSPTHPEIRYKKEKNNIELQFSQCYYKLFMEDQIVAHLEPMAKFSSISVASTAVTKTLCL